MKGTVKSNDKIIKFIVFNFTFIFGMTGEHVSCHIVNDHKRGSEAAHSLDEVEK